MHIHIKKCVGVWAKFSGLKAGTYVVLGVERQLAVRPIFGLDPVDALLQLLRRERVSLRTRGLIRKRVTLNGQLPNSGHSQTCTKFTTGTLLFLGHSKWESKILKQFTGPSDSILSTPSCSSFVANAFLFHFLRKKGKVSTRQPATFGRIDAHI